jgi:hypothetical protein
MTMRTAYINGTRRKKLEQGYNPMEALEAAKEAWERKKERMSGYYPY